MRPSTSRTAGPPAGGLADQGYGVAGLVFVLRQRLGIDVPKDDPRLQAVYSWLIAEFDNGRQTSVEWEEMR